jgi:cell wall-associated NlpC family hydrolase
VAGRGLRGPGGWVVLWCGAALLLAACGGGGAGSDATQRSAPPAPSASTPSTSSTSSTPTVVSPYVTLVPLPVGCVTVGPEIVGVKVYLVRQALGLVGHLDRYDASTASAVRGFQAAHGLPVTGLVDERTWTALRTGQPFCIDRYTAQPTLGPGATVAARSAAMLGYAASRLGVPYIWGGAGPIGYDCSGLALQAMYAGGRVVPGVTTDRHIQATFNTAEAIYRSSALLHVPLGQRRAGDLVFWGSDFSHLALYLGNDRIVEAVRPSIRTASLWVHGTPLPTVVRPFPG